MVDAAYLTRITKSTQNNGFIFARTVIWSKPHHDMQSNSRVHVSNQQIKATERQIHFADSCLAARHEVGSGERRKNNTTVGTCKSNRTRHRPHFRTFTQAQTLQYYSPLLPPGQVHQSKVLPRLLHSPTNSGIPIVRPQHFSQLKKKTTKNQAGYVSWDKSLLTMHIQQIKNYEYYTTTRPKAAGRGPSSIHTTVNQVTPQACITYAHGYDTLINRNTRLYTYRDNILSFSKAHQITFPLPHTHTKHEGRSDTQYRGRVFLQNHACRI